MPFPQVQGLNSAWQWHQKGIDIPVLQRRLHPFYGTYFPTRFGHLQLLQSWLRSYAGPRQLAWDVGTGCGVLALLLVQEGFARVVATDNNPNAVESVRRELARQPAGGKIDLAEADLLGLETGVAATDVELILFNPPWIVGVPEGPIDQAVYYEPGLFERFFQQAHERLASDGRVVLLFSNLQETADPSIAHPVEAELAAGGRFVLSQKLCQQVQPSAPAPKRRKRQPATESVELWELAPKP